ncbi:MAG TPA: DUF1761 domain-containing protein [Bacteroidia bacterium]|nr:DUF1761 domain-containing protein [Bacteroidia bacterium]HNT79746.1 DUF1761 domain-containing protein [Bacteroidia bacterium]
MELNFYISFVAALVPLVLGFIWYNPKVFGTAWMNVCGLTEEKLKGANMPVIFLLSYVLSVMLALAMYSIVIHQLGVFSTLIADESLMTEGSELNLYFADFMSKYGSNFRTFKHGVFHGAIAGIFIVLPIMATNAMFERKGAKYIFINAGYWIVCFMLMGGIICAWA